MKLCILGGGGFRTPYVYQALLRDQGSPRVTEVALYDVDESRLHAMTAILMELAAEFPDAPRLVPTTDLHRAIEGSDFIFAAVRIGGLEGRRCDEHVALDLNVLGQETTGPGGLAYAMRTVPVMLEMAQIVKDLAPNAYFLNFTNPAGIITEAMQSVLGDRVLGICDTPSGLGRRVAGLMGLDHTRVQMDYVGLNHLGWMRRVMYDGRDILPELMNDDAKLDLMEEGQVFGLDWIRTLGSIPNEYLYYYYFNRDAVRGIVDSKMTRGDFLQKTQSEFYERAQTAGNGVADLWRHTVENRSASYMAEARGGEQGAPAQERDREEDPSHQGYAGVALGVMAAITRNERATMILNVRNNGTIQGLPDDAVVEVPTTVDANGVHPQSTNQPDLHQLGLMQQVKAVERHTIAAATTGSKDEALKAFALHPLVDSVTVARELLNGYIDRIPEVAAVLTK
jgi:6-phospho-beta-glucosidase